MKTEQLMKREFHNSIVTQRTSDSFFNATDLLTVYNSKNVTQKRFKDFWENNTVKNFVEVLENDLILNGHNKPYFNKPIKSWESTRGRNGSTFMHPYLFVKFAMWLSPEFELAIIRWVYDNLIEVRHHAGDGYAKMCEAIQENYISLTGGKPDPFVFVNEANFLNNLCYGKNEAGKRNELSEKELRLLSDLQRLNTKLITDKTETTRRKQLLAEYANNFKFINFQ